MPFIAPAASSYTFYNVTRSHVIGVSFGPVSTPTCSAGQTWNGTGCVVATPSITLISSNSGSVGSSVIINGSNFNFHLPNRVMFSDSHYLNGIPGITYVTGVTSSDGSKVTFIVPNISATDGWVSVVNAVNQQSNSFPFTITAPVYCSMGQTWNGTACVAQ